MNQNKIQSVILKSKGKKERSVLDVDAVVDATGGAGGMKFCKEHGYGCVGCILRCPTFGSRVSVAARAGVKEKVGLTLFGKEGTLSSAYSLIKASVAPFVRDEIEKNGYGCFPIPKEMVDYERTQSITASGNIDNGFAENLVVIDNGFAKVMAAGFRPLNELHKIPGFEHARYADPIAGGVGNAVRYAAITPRDSTLKVQGITNLYVAGEKMAVNGIVEVAILGLIAGHNAACCAGNRLDRMFQPNQKTFIGSFINYVNNHQETREDLKLRTHMWVGPFFDKAKKEKIYTLDQQEIERRIENLGLKNILSQSII